MGACDFCLSCSGLMGDKFFSLSLMFLMDGLVTYEMAVLLEILHY